MAEHIRKWKKEELIIKLENNESLRDVITRFIPAEKLSLIGLTLANKKFVNLDYIVQDVDKIIIFPLLNGG